MKISTTEETELLKKISSTLDDIKAILALSNEEKIAEAKKTILKEGSVKLRIYDLCDGTRSSQDIVQIIGKKSEYVGSYISTLRREGLIRTVEKNGKQVHEQTF